jgi:hypothetical protein
MDSGDRVYGYSRILEWLWPNLLVAACPHIEHSLSTPSITNVLLLSFLVDLLNSFIRRHIVLLQKFLPIVYYDIASRSLITELFVFYKAFEGFRVSRSSAQEREKVPGKNDIPVGRCTMVGAFFSGIMSLHHF